MEGPGPGRRRRCRTSAKSRPARANSEVQGSRVACLPSSVHHERLEAGDGAVAGGAAGAGGAVLLEAGVAVQKVQAGQHHAVALDLQAEGRRGEGWRGGQKAGREGR